MPKYCCKVGEQSKANRQEMIIRLSSRKYREME